MNGCCVGFSDYGYGHDDDCAMRGAAWDENPYADVQGHVDDGSTYYEDQARERERVENWERRVFGRPRRDLRTADYFAPAERPAIPAMPMVQNPPTPEALISQLRWSVDSGWRESMATFRASGLSDTTLGWLIAVTTARPGLPTDARWRYFCGCCWTTIRGRR
ncbi:hypothetical protein SEA_BIGGITYBASS_77 [Gordonia phage BiggityBass]|nr:hypothetical protein SEA_BIGGITYBASS_77 [Gordonia phage BiggityBass]